MSTDKERMETLLAHLKMNANEFASSLGYKRTDKIYNVVKGRNGISASVARDIHNAYQNINYEWLVDGTGEMLKSEDSPSLEVKDGKIKVNLLNMPLPLEQPTKTGFSMVDGFSEKLRLLGYEAPKEEKGYKIIALDLADRLNRATSMSEEMVGIVSKPLLDRIGFVEKQKAMVEARAAALEAKLAAMSIKEAK